MRRLIHDFFGLTYSSYLVIPRLALQEMPEEWQERFVALLEDARAIGMETPSYEVRRRKNGRFITDPWANYRRGTVAEAQAAE